MLQTSADVNEFKADEHGWNQISCRNRIILGIPCEIIFLL